MSLGLPLLQSIMISTSKQSFELTEGDRVLQTNSGLTDPNINSGLVIDSICPADTKEVLS